MARTYLTQRGHSITVQLSSTAEPSEIQEQWSEIVLKLNAMPGVIVLGGSFEPVSLIETAASAEEGS